MKKGEAAKKAAARPRRRSPPRRPQPAKKAAAVAKRRKSQKAPAADDVLAPPPGTTITKIAKVEPKKNGIRDMNIALFGLRDKAIKQVMINCQTATGPVGWRLDTSDSQDWPVVIERIGRRADGRHLPRAAAGRLLRERLHDQHQLRGRPGRQREHQGDARTPMPSLRSTRRRRPAPGPTSGST